METRRSLAESSGRGDYAGRYDGPSPRPPSISLTDLHARRSSTTAKTTPIVDNFLSIIPVGHEKALKYAFYNVLAMVLSGFLLFMLWGVYCVLNPFLKSLLWAVLVGTVLYPFKKNLSGSTRTWLQNVKNSPTPFVIRIVTSPLVVADNISDAIGDYVLMFWKSTAAALGLFVLTYIFYYNPPTTLVSIGHFIATLLWSILQLGLKWIVNLPVVVALNAVYVGHLITTSLKKGKAEISESSKQEEEKSDKTDGVPDPSSINTPPSVTSPSKQDEKPQNQSALYTQILPYAALIITFIYVCLNILPYSFLVGLIVFITIGIVTYFQGTDKPTDDSKEEPVKSALPSLSRYALMVLNIGTPVGTPKGTPKTLSQLTTAEKRARMLKSWSESSATSAAGINSQGISREPSERSILEGSDSQEESTLLDRSGSDGVDANGGDAVLLDSNKFLYGVFCACVIVQIWNHPWIMHLLPLPVVYYGLKKLCFRFGVNNYIDNRIRAPIKNFFNKQSATNETEDDEANQVLPIRLIFRILSAADRRLISICEDCLDPVSSMLVLVFVGIAFVLGLIFLATQVYSEGDHLVRVSVNLVNSTVSQYPEINEMLPDGWQSIMTSMVGNAYLYGRETITNLIRDSIAEKNPEKAEQIEKQLIELWDKIYETWNHTWDNAFPDQLTSSSGGGVSGGKAVDWDELLETGKEMPHLFELSVLTNYAKANVGTLWSILESVWNILIGNVSLVFSAVTSVVSVLFGGGTAILNLIINFVIFFTALFYLLSSSTDVYKPVELFNLFSPSGGSGGRTSGFAKAVEEAVNGVFAASFKMAAFYGMWTWLIHTLFQVNIVFLPSIFGALFGAVPILAPYFAALPAVLELWLIQGHWPKALFMFLAQMAPMSMVDTQIYSEIKAGGHPYLTGLAIAGGIFYFGIQGAIMGPVILCCGFVAIKVGSSFMRDEEVGRTDLVSSTTAESAK